MQPVNDKVNTKCQINRLTKSHEVLMFVCSPNNTVMPQSSTEFIVLVNNHHNGYCNTYTTYRYWQYLSRKGSIGIGGGGLASVSEVSVAVLITKSLKRPNFQNIHFSKLIVLCNKTNFREVVG